MMMHQQESVAFWVANQTCTRNMPRSKLIAGERSRSLFQKLQYQFPTLARRWVGAS